jgi:hypothetical protein
MFCAGGHFTLLSSLRSSVSGGRDATRELSRCSFPPCPIMLAARTPSGVILEVVLGFFLPCLHGLAVCVMPVLMECNFRTLYSLLEVMPSPRAMRSGYGTLFPKSRLPCGLLTFLPVGWRGRPQLKSPRFVCALTYWAQVSPTVN